eukprot:1303669-Pleurochrysis_carterae.AAC.3
MCLTPDGEYVVTGSVEGARVAPRRRQTRAYAQMWPMVSHATQVLDDALRPNKCCALCTCIKTEASDRARQCRLILLGQTGACHCIQVVILKSCMPSS